MFLKYNSIYVYLLYIHIYDIKSLIFQALSYNRKLVLFSGNRGLVWRKEREF